MKINTTTHNRKRKIYSKKDKRKRKINKTNIQSTKNHISVIL